MSGCEWMGNDPDSYITVKFYYDDDYGYGENPQYQHWVMDLFRGEVTYCHLRWDKLDVAGCTPEGAYNYLHCTASDCENTNSCNGGTETFVLSTS